MSSNVRFAPPLGPEEMPDAYCASDVVLSLPPSDGTPQSVMEAMACGTPVVIGNLERFRDTFSHNADSVLVDLDSKRIAEGILSLLSDKQFAGRVTDGGRSLVARNADLEHEARKVETIFYNLAGARKA